jgi:hypothetical protein
MCGSSANVPPGQLWGGDLQKAILGLIPLSILNTCCCSGTGARGMALETTCC